MATRKFYVGIYVVLALLSTTQVALEFSGLLAEYYMEIGAVIMVLSTLKAVGVAAWYMHLTDEPRSITYLAGTAVVIVMLLAIAASYSIL